MIKTLRASKENELDKIAHEIRQFILKSLSVKEGHLGASLGVVELTIALHYLFNTPDDKLVFDVGHQAYAHKILTDRKEKFHTNRSWNGISGFPSLKESPYDSFGVGHASTSISAVVGMATASLLEGNKTRKHIAVIGDASFVGGLSFEALNLTSQETNILIILNDNQMSIDPSVGNFKEFLKESYQGNASIEKFLTAFNIDFLGSIDGHSFEALLPKLKQAKERFGVQLLHIRTLKGKGLKQAETHQTLYHAPGKFNPETGERIPSAEIKKTYPQIVGEIWVELFKRNEHLLAITPAMLSGSSLTALKEKYPERVFDVGIAEAHAITFAAGIATSQKWKPVCIIYSSFLQRGYDQIIHDICLQELKIIFCIDRAGLVGEDGATHQGVFDIAYLRCIPNLEIYAPSTPESMLNILNIVQNKHYKKAVAIRYPKTLAKEFKIEERLKDIFEETPQEIQEHLIIRPITEGKSVAILALGTIVENCIKALEWVEDKDEFSLFSVERIKPVAKDFLTEVFNRYDHIITIEEGSRIGGFGSSVLELASELNLKKNIKILGVQDEFIPQGSIAEQQHYCGLSAEKIAEVLNHYIKK